MTAAIRAARFLQDRKGPRGNQNTVVCWETAATAAAATAWRCSAVPSMRASLTLQYQFFITNSPKTEIKKRLLSEALGFSFSLLEPHGELTLGHLEVLDVSSSAIEKRDLAGLLVGDGERVLEAAVTLPEFVTPTLLGLNTLTADLLPAS